MRIFVYFLLFFVVGCTPDVAPVAPTPVPSPTVPSIPVKPVPTPVAVTAGEASLMQAHTPYRGGDALLVSPALVDMARAQAKWMAENQDMTHERPQKFTTRFARSGYTGYSGGENVAYGYRTTSLVMTGWMKSPGHRQNILGNWTHIGGSYAQASDGRIYWCVVFGRTHVAAAEAWETLPHGLEPPGD